MNKKVRLNVDLVISDEKNEVVDAQSDSTEIATPQAAGIITTSRIMAKRKKKRFIIALVTTGMLLFGLAGYTFANHGREEKVQGVQTTDEVNIIDAREDGALEDGIYISDLIDREHGPNEGIVDRIDQFPTDEVTREIIDKGFYYELDNIMEDGIFRLEMVAATGDMYYPQLLLNIYVDDEEIVAKNDKIEVYAYCLGEETYETQLKNYGQWNAYGEQDEKNPHLYHVTLPSGIWLSSGDRVVFDMTTIRLGSQKTQWQDYKVSLKTTLKIPYIKAFFPSCQIENTGLEFKTDTKTYKLYWTDIGYYSTSMEFHYDFEDGQSGSDSEKHQWYQFVNELILEVNGVEYKVDPGSKGYIQLSDDGDEKFYYVHPTFPGIKDNEINSVVIKYKDTGYRLK